ncbi:MAG: hypothetical protein RBS80_07295 [Thermoguttaceae bacterium]|jgi:hypothetical protein|nr:hypothetical protein [Thermoguttaceae bacterium]
MMTKPFAITILLAALVAPVHADTAFSITSFGGAADGKTDNAPAFRRAMQEVAKAGGGQILFPPAVEPYLVRDTLLIDVSNVEVLGTGATVRLADGASNGRRTNAVQVSGTSDEPVENVTLRGLTVDANYWAQENAATPRGIQVMWARKVLLDRVRIVRPWVGLSLGRGTVDSEARDCEVNLWHNDAYSVDGAGYSGSTKRIRLLRCRAVGSPNEADGGLPGRRDNAFEIEDGCQDVELIECQVANAGGTGFGIRNHAQPREVKTRGITLTRCTVQDVPTALAARSRGGDNRVMGISVVYCNMLPNVQFHRVGGEVRVEGGRFGNLAFVYRDIPQDEAPVVDALVRNARVDHLRADLPSPAAGTLRIEKSTILKALETTGEGVTVADSEMP